MDNLLKNIDSSIYKMEIHTAPTHDFISDINSKNNTISYDVILQNNWQTNQTLMSVSVNNRNIPLIIFLLENGYPLYDVKIFRKILSSFNMEKVIDTYLELEINLNDARLYEPEEIEDYTYYYSNQVSDSDSEHELKEVKPYIFKLDSPVLFHTNNIMIIKKFIDHGIDLDKNIYSTEKGGALKKAIGYGDMKLVKFYMGFLKKDFLQNEEWWVNMLDHVSQDGNVGQGSNKCYEILLEIEKLLDSNKLPSRKIFDIVKTKWYYDAKDPDYKFCD